MASYNDVDPLKYASDGGEEFSIYRDIEKCPSGMMMRELTQNAIEASTQDVSGKGFIRFYPTFIPELGDAPKLSIWNNGPGMSRKDLHLMSDLSVVLNKIRSLTDNYGIGAKIASLKSNKKGLRIRSCRQGSVHETILKLSDDGKTYGRMKYQYEDGTTDTIDDVTDIVAQEGRYSTEDEWTEVTLFGNEYNQNTCFYPYDPKVKEDQLWLGLYLFNRYFRIPENAEIRFHQGTHSRPDEMSPRQFWTMTAMDNRIKQDGSAWWDKHDIVRCQDGIKIHFFHDPKSPNRSGTRAEDGNMFSFGSRGGIVYKNEFYDLRSNTTKQKWSDCAHKLGIRFGWRFISVIVELPDNYLNIASSSDRSFLSYTDKPDEEVKLEDFSEIMWEYRPQWVLDKIKEYDKSISSSEKSKKRLQEKLDRLKLKKTTPQVSKEGEEASDDETAERVRIHRPWKPRPPTPPNPNPPNNDTIRINIAKRGQRKIKYDENLYIMPDPQWLDDEEDILTKIGAGMFASYDGNNTLYLNLNHKWFNDAWEALCNHYPGYPDQAEMREAAREKIKEQFEYLVGSAWITARSNEIEGIWSSSSIEKGYSPESLSVSAGFWEDMMSDAMLKMSRYNVTSLKQAS
jgi:hypothetical protein